MKKMLLLVSLFTVAAGALLAQGNPTERKLLPSTQAVLNAMVNTPNVLVVTGKIMDAETNQPITDAKINFDKFGDELLQAAIDKNGNYALAINRKEIGDPVSIIFKVEGYNKYAARNINKNAAVVDLDLQLQPDGSKEASAAHIKYQLSSDPFNTLVIKF